VSGYRLRLRAVGPALLGGLGERQPGVHAASGLLPGQGAGAAGGSHTAVLLGSSLKGVLRHDAARLAEARGQATCRAQPQGCGACVVCQVFGAPNQPGKLAVRSATAIAADLGVASSVGIDRRTRTADRAGRRLWSELRALADFEVDLAAAVPLTGEEAQLVEGLLDWEQATGLRLGRRKSAGLGAFDLAWQRLDQAAPVTGGRLLGAQAGTPARYLVHIQAVEPLRLAGPPRRVFLRDSLEVIPATTLRGALGWALAHRGDGDAAGDLFIDRPVRLSEGVHQAPNGLPGRWLGVLECRAAIPHRIDPTMRLVGDALGDHTSTAELLTCPVAGCGAWLKPAAAARPPLLVVGQTKIDPVRRRVREGLLFHQVVVRPGATFTAELVALPEQADLLAGLAEVLVGGNRSRGLGRALLSVEPAPPLPPVAERVAHTTAMARRRGGGLDDAEELAVLGLVSDGFAAVPLRALLADRGLTVVAGEVRAVARGSYDERDGGARPQRRLLARGSWVAVRGRDLPARLLALERDGIDDPAGLQPLWLRVRHDLEDNADAPA
jgi:CRISPR/Cas system CSM-associated protein Csm3 (group 7 of RAMP superfamily)